MASLAETRARPVRQLLKQPGWERRLIRWAQSQVGQSFRWGETDCGSLVVQAIRVMCGESSFDPGVAYRTLNEAMRTVVDTGGIRETLLRFGLTEHSIRLAHQGDIIVLPPWTGNPLEEASVLVGGKLLSSVEDLGIHWTTGRDMDTVAMRI